MTKATLRAIDRRPAKGTARDFLKQAPPLPVLAETAHDLNNALSAIRLQLDLLAQDLQAHDLRVDDRLADDLPAHEAAAHDCATDKLRRRLRQLQKAVQHASEIAQQLMNPGNLTNAQPCRTPLNPVLQRMVPILSAMLPPRVDLHLKLAPDENHSL